MTGNKKQQQIEICSQTLHAICDFSMLDTRETKFQADITRGASKNNLLRKNIQYISPTHPAGREWPFYDFRLLVSTDNCEKAVV